MKIPNSAQTKQEGVVMIIALIMLVAVTLMVVSGSNLVQANLRVVQNIETREQVRFAALAAIDEAVSSPRFIEIAEDESMFLESCEEINHKCYDYNGDGTMDVRVEVQRPTCVVVQPRRNSDLDVFNSQQQASCYLPPAAYSMCGDSVWDFQATATDLATGAEVTVRQGVSVLTSLNKIETACPI
jgi:hypothetical protein